MDITKANEYMRLLPVDELHDFMLLVTAAAHSDRRFTLPEEIKKRGVTIGAKVWALIDVNPNGHMYDLLMKSIYAHLPQEEQQRLLTELTYLSQA